MFLLHPLVQDTYHFYGTKLATFGFSLGTKIGITQNKKNLKTGAFWPHQISTNRFSSENRCYSWKFSGNSTHWRIKLLRILASSRLSSVQK
jgi:hypothetical protein